MEDSNYLLDDNKEEIAYDLKTNEPITGDYFVVSSRIADEVIALRNAGYNVIGSFYPDNYFIFYNESKTTSSKDIKEIKEEGNKIFETRRITSINEDGVTYDSFSARNYFYVDFSKDKELPSIPDGFELIELEDRYRIKVSLPIEKQKSFFGDGFIVNDSPINEFRNWACQILNVDRVPSIPKNENDKYGNPYRVFDSKTNTEYENPYMFCDYMIVPVIQELRSKGYDTKGCCSGHFDNLFIQNTGVLPSDDDHFVMDTSTWVVFSGETPIQGVPNGVEYNTNGGFIKVIIPISSKKEDGTFKTSQELKEELIKDNRLLLKWAKELPSLSKSLS